MSFRVVFFGYSWTADRNPDAYQTALIQAFQAQGAQVNVILSNSLVEYDALYGIHPRVSEKQILESIRKLDPTLVVSMNGGGLRRKIKEQIKAPVVTWIVDDFAHLFYPDGPGNLDGFVSAKDPLVISSVDLFENFRGMFPEWADYIHFVPSATNSAAFRKSPAPKKHNISFVGSFLDYSDLKALFDKTLSHFPDRFDGFLAALDRMLKDYRHDLEKTVQEFGLDEVLRDCGCTPEYFKMLSANLISSRDRMKAVEKVHDLGLALFGNKEWVLPLLFSGDSITSYQAGRSIRTHQELIDVYQQSKICINVNQIQTGPALSYRAFDILASDALLIQPYHPRSDAYAIFGKECPIPMYRDFEHLRELCQYFLSHESERQELVLRCNRLVSNGFSFEDRIKDLMRFAGKAVPMPTEEATLHYFKYKQFRRRFYLPSYQEWKRGVRRVLVWSIYKIFNRAQRLRLSRLFVEA